MNEDMLEECRRLVELHAGFRHPGRMARGLAWLVAEVERLGADLKRDREAFHSTWVLVLRACGHEPDGDHSGIVTAVQNLAAERDRLRAEVVAERKACAALIQQAAPVTVYRTDSTGEEWEAVDWPATAERLATAIRARGKEGPHARED